jgi:hypothetical protein
MTDSEATSSTAKVRVWTNVPLDDPSPDGAGRCAAAHAALAQACAAHPGVHFERNPVLNEGYVDAYAEGPAALVAPMLRALGGRGLSYAIDVDEEEALDEIADACGSGCLYAE